MLLPQLLAIALAPALVSAALFPKDTKVKQLDAKGFRKMMKQNSTSVVAFTAPWCGHCQRMAPEFSKAALGVYPFITFYNVDCDDSKNKQLCSEQGVQGFPTVKLFPRGKLEKPIPFEHEERSASAFYYWASRNIPHGVKKVYHFEDLPAWVEEGVDRPRAMLINNGKGIPLLWQALSNKYKDHISFGIHRDRHHKSSLAMGFEAGPKGSSKVLIYPAGSTEFIRYEGKQKFEPLSKFFDSVVDGTADLRIAVEEAKNAEYIPTEEELETERLQEAQRMALAHGGFNDIEGFQEAVMDAVKSGHAADYHSTHGYSAGAEAHHGEAHHGDAHKEEEKPEDPIHKILKAQQKAAEESAKEPKMAKTGDAGQVVFEPETKAGHTRTGVPTPAASDSETGTTIPQATRAKETGASNPAAGDEEGSRPKDEL